MTKWSQNVLLLKLVQYLFHQLVKKLVKVFFEYNNLSLNIYLQFKL